MKSKRNFTLIELLTVIVIISLLTAMLFPVLAKAREQVRRITCTNNLKQIGTAWNMYIEDWKFFPRYDATGVANIISCVYGGSTGTDASFNLNKTRRILNDYVFSNFSAETNTDVFHCPSDTTGKIMPGTSCYNDLGSSYATNLLISLFFAGPPARTVQSLSGASFPVIKADISKMILGADVGFFERVDSDPSPGYSFHDNNKKIQNLLFLDGHVKLFSVNIDEFESDNWTTDSNPSD